VGKESGPLIRTCDRVRQRLLEDRHRLVGLAGSGVGAPFVDLSQGGEPVQLVAQAEERAALAALSAAAG
jgi:hypothetical protein